MINKIIFFNNQSLTDKIIEDFFFLNFIKSGFDLEYWDLSNLVFKNKTSCIIQDQKIKIIKLSKLDEFESKIKQMQINETLFVSLITYEYRVINIFKLLTKYSCKTSFFARGAQPLVSIRTNIVLYILNRIRSIFSLNKLHTIILNKYAFYLKKNRKVKLYDIVFCAGLEGLRVIGHGYEIEKVNSQIQYINTIDYDIYQKNNELKNEALEKYCVFLDEYLPYHPDFDLLNIRTISPDCYYKSINTFFDQIEEKFNLKVLIAAHPKAILYKKINPFQGRQIVFNSTSKLVKFSEFIIAHNTTSISFAILNSKQILIVSTNDIKEKMPNYNILIENNSFVIGTNFTYIESFNKTNFDLPIINEFKYEKFKYNFLTTKESEFAKSFEIILNSIKKL